jgi:hypothetical protein
LVSWQGWASRAVPVDTRAAQRTPAYTCAGRLRRPMNVASPASANRPSSPILRCARCDYTGDEECHRAGPSRPRNRHARIGARGRNPADYAVDSTHPPRLPNRPARAVMAGHRRTTDRMWSWPTVTAGMSCGGTQSNGLPTMTNPPPMPFPVRGRHPFGQTIPANGRQLRVTGAS